MKAQPRRLFEPFVLIDCEEKAKRTKLVLVVGADEPLLLEKQEAKDFAKNIASKKGFKTLAGMGEIKLFGQNALALREFYYKK